MKVIQGDETVSRVQPFLLVGNGDYPANPNPRQDIGAYLTVDANMTLPSTTTWAGVTWRIANYNLSTNNITVTLAGGDSYLFGGNVLVVRPGEMYALTAIVSSDNNTKIVAPVGWFTAPTAVPKPSAIPMTGNNNRLDAGFMPDISCLSYNAGNQSVNNNSSTVLTMDAESFDTAGIHSTSSNTSRHTIPTGQGGLWMFVGRSYCANTVATGFSDLQIWKNGAATTLAESTQINSVAVGAILQVVWCGQATAGDYFELVAFQNTGSARNFNGWTSAANYGTSLFSRRMS